METITLVAPDISCEHCRRAVTEALGDVPGVETTSVDVESKTVTVSFDPVVTGSSAISRTLTEAGYPPA